MRVWCAAYLAGAFASLEVARANASNSSHVLFARLEGASAGVAFDSERDAYRSVLAALWAFKSPVAPSSRLPSRTFAIRAPDLRAAADSAQVSHEDLMYWVRHRWDAERVPARARALHLVSTAAEWALAAAVCVYFLSFVFEMRVSTLYAPEFQYVYVGAEKFCRRRSRAARHMLRAPLPAANAHMLLVEEPSPHADQRKICNQQPQPSVSPTPSISSIYPAQSPRESLTQTHAPLLSPHSS